VVAALVERFSTFDIHLHFATAQKMGHPIVDKRSVTMASVPASVRTTARASTGAIGNKVAETTLVNQEAHESHLHITRDTPALFA
jgi:hypothetical protein